MPDQPSTSGSFDLEAIARAFPETADTMLLDRYLSDGPSASSRVFRIYRPTPAHYHAHCDEHLYVLSGRGTFWMNDSTHPIAFAPGTFLIFPRNTIHAMPEITEYPVVFLSVDTPRRQPNDVIFVNPEEGSPETFIRKQE